MTIKGNKKDALMNLLKTAFKAGYDSCLLDEDLYNDGDTEVRDCSAARAASGVEEYMKSEFEKWEQCNPNHYVDAIIDYMIDEIP